MQTIVQHGLMLLVLLGCPFSSAAAQADGGWPQWRGPDRSGVTEAKMTAWPPRQAWEVRFERSESSPIIADGKVYCLVGGERATVVCLSATDGHERWRQDFGSQRVTHGRFARGDMKRYRGPLSTPAVGGGSVVALGVDGDLVALDVDSGEQRWQVNLHDACGVVQRDAKRDFGCCSSPIITDDQVIVGVGGTQGTVMIFSLRDGRAGDSWGTGQWGHTSGPASLDGRVYMTLDHLVIGSQRIPWQTKFACNIPTPAVSGELVAATSGYNVKRTRLYCNGEQVWESKVHATTTSPIICEDKVYVGGSCLSVRDGSQLWSFEADSFLLCNGGDRMLAEHKGTLRCYDTGNGRVLGAIDNVPKGNPSIAYGEGCILVKGGGALACYMAEPR